MVTRAFLLAFILAFASPSAALADELGVGNSSSSEPRPATPPPGEHGPDDELGVGERSTESGCAWWEYFFRLFGG